MISFRYHVVTVVGILFALAAGVVLGSGLGGSDPTSSVTTDQSVLADRLDEAQQQLAAAESALAWDEKFVAGVASQTVRGSLSGQAVLLVVAPGSSPDTVAALTRLVSTAGGSLTGRIDLGKDLLDPASRQLVDQLGAQLASSTKRLKVPTGLTGYDRFGWLLARSAVTRADAGDARDQTATTVAAGLSAAHLATLSKDLRRRASLVLVVGPSVSPSDGAAGATILGALVSQLASAGAGVMVVADSVEGAPAAVVEAIRDDASLRRAVATEDTPESTSGRVVAVLGLAAAGEGSIGQYGVGASATAVTP